MQKAGDYGIEFDSSSDDDSVEQGESSSPRRGPMSHLESVSRLMNQGTGTSLFTVPTDAFANFHIQAPQYLTKSMNSPDRRELKSPDRVAVSSLLITPGNVDMSGSTSFVFSPKRDEFTIPAELPMMAPEVSVETTIFREPRFVFDNVDAPRFPFSAHRTLTAVIEEDEEGNAPAQVPDIRRRCKINEINVKELLGRFSEVSKTQTGNESMWVDREGFREVLDSLYEINRIIPPQEDGALDSLFDWLNRSEDKERITTQDLITGLVLSAGGTREDKMATIFSLVDSKDEGSLAIDELVMFFSLIFQNVFNKRIVGAMLFNGVNARDPDALALRTATECMDMCELNDKGRITYEELTRWFEKPRHSPILGPTRYRRN
jgi:Ca2+-binding EF-hand superfamily protein